METKRQVGFQVYHRKGKPVFFNDQNSAIENYTYTGWKVTKLFVDNSEEILKNKGNKNEKFNGKKN